MDIAFNHTLFPGHNTGQELCCVVFYVIPITCWVLLNYGWEEAAVNTSGECAAAFCCYPPYFSTQNYRKVMWPTCIGCVASLPSTNPLPWPKEPFNHLKVKAIAGVPSKKASIDINSCVQPMIEQLSIKTFLKMIYANNCFGKANLISTKSSCGVTAEILISV